MSRLHRLLASLLVLALTASAVEAAGLPVTIHQADSAQFPTVRVYVSVANEQGVPYVGLDNQAFELLEEDKPVSRFEVSPFTASQEPIAIALTIDVSGSMNDENKMQAAKEAASAFIDTMGPRDTAAIVSFSSQVKVVQPFTGDKASLKNAIGGLKAEGATLLYDAVAQSAQLLKAVPPQRKVLLVLSDGADETSRQFSADTASAAASGANSPIFSIGLGKDVKRDVLDKMAATTAGQAVYVANPGQLRQVFLSVGDQLRRQYVLQYTSSLPADDKPHAVTVRVKYRGETGEAKSSFVAKRAPLGVEIRGLANASAVSGTQRVEVTITSGTPQQVELLVDEQSRGVATAPPFAIAWDTSKEKPGIHRVLVRAKDSAGSTTEREFVVEVLVPTPAPSATPAPKPTAAAPATAPTAAPRATPTPPPAQADSTILYVLGGLGALALVGTGVGAFVMARRRRPSPTPPKAAKPAPVDDDVTLTMPDRVVPADLTAPVADVGATVVHAPRGRLRLTHRGSTQEYVIEGETVLGRAATNPIVVNDPLASRRHAKVFLENGDFWVEDLQSLNGTRVNGEVIATRLKLNDSDQITIGDAVLTFTKDEG